MTYPPMWTPAARAGIVPLHPLTFGTIVGRSFTALRRNPKVLLGFAIGMQLVAYLVLIIAVGVVAFATFSRLDSVPIGSDDYETVMIGSVVITVIVGFVLGLATGALTVMVQGVVIAEVSHAVVSEKLNLSALWARVKPAFWRLFGYSMLATVAIAIGFVVVAAVAFGLGTLTPAAGIIFGVLAVLGAIPLTLWLTTKLLLVPAVLVLEGKGVFAAIARSWQLTRVRFWVTLGVWILIQFAFGAIAQIISVPFQLVGTFIPAIIAPTGQTDVAAIATVLGTSVLAQILILLVQAVALVVLSSAVTLLYVDARMRSEGLDHDLQSYVDQRQSGAGVADPYSWHIGRSVTPQPAYPSAPMAPPQMPGGHAQ